MSMFTNGYVYEFGWLCNMMRARIETVIYNGSIRAEGIINGIRPEDGSGNHWLVTVLNTSTGKANEVYVRTT